MLNQHALDGFFGKIGIDGPAAEGVEVVEDVAEGWILSALVFDQAFDLLGKFGDADRKFFYRFEPFLDVLRFVFEELIDDGDEGFGAGDVFVEDARAALVEDGALRGLEDGVV